MIPPPPQKAEESSLGTTLLELGVFILAPAKLRATAVSLAAVGVTVDELRDLARFIAETEEDAGKQRKYLAAVLMDLERTKLALKNVAAHRAEAAKAKAPEPDEGPAHMVNMPIGTASCLCHTCRDHRSAMAQEPWDHDRQCHMAACLAGGDRWTIERVAAHFGVSDATARSMVERGNCLKGSRQEPAKKKVKDDTTHEDLCRRFREATRSERLRLLKGDASTREEARS